MKDIVIDCVAVLIGDYAINRKKAAMLLLKHYLPTDFLKFLFEDNNLYPFDRNDKRVKEWKAKVLEKGKCEMCGSTKNLEAHHYIKWADYPMGRIDVNNGMCLCHDCHTTEHKDDRSFHMMKAKCG